MRPPRISDYSLTGQRVERLFRAGVGATWQGSYLHWDELQQMQLPMGLAPREWWIGTKLVRRSMSRAIGRFTVSLPESAIEALHRIDRHELPAATGRLAVNAMIQEAVSSAQLAGASTPREVATELLRSRRKPRDEDERLVCDTFELLQRATVLDRELEHEGFVHPAVRAIVLHLGQDDRRVGRAAFYGAMIASGYDCVRLLSLSTSIRRDAESYERTFEHVASDDDDATYFVLNQLDAISRAIDDARRAADHKERELTGLRKLAGDFNDRQLALLDHALANAGAHYTIEAHRASHDIVYETARADLRELAGRQLLRREKVGRAFTYTPAADLSARLRNP